MSLTRRGMAGVESADESQEEDVLTAPLIPTQSDVNMNDSNSAYRYYVLALLLFTYLLNQLDRYMLAVVTKPMAQEIHYGDQSCMTNESSPIQTPLLNCQKLLNESSCSDFMYNGSSHGCKWDYTGQGYDYQILAGPIFILVYTFTAIPVGIAADFYNRKLLLGISLGFWSVCTLLSGLVSSYWQLAILRFGVGLGEAGCTPFATSLIADYFGQNSRGLALGVYNWGIYTGYSLSYALGNFITNANINNQGWRWSFIVAGIPGIVVGFLILLTVKEPVRDQSLVRQLKGRKRDKLRQMIQIFRPSIFILCIASSIRNAAGYVWAYNTQTYLESIGQTSTQIGFWMSWVPIVGGSFGVVFGGFVSDRVVRRTGPHGRIWVLALSQIVSSPFAAGVLYLNPPYCYLSLLANYIFGEMWVGVALAVLVELVPSDIRTTTIAAYFFIISNIGGNMPLLVPTIKNLFGGAGFGEMESLRNSLYLLYPGEYILGAVLFLVTLAVLRRDIAYIQLQQMKKENSEQCNSEVISRHNSLST